MSDIILNLTATMMSIIIIIKKKLYIINSYSKKL